MILVTGSTGHIGNVLARELVNLGEKVRVLLLPGESRAPIDSLQVEVVEGDILKPDTLVPAFQGIDLVYHLAGMISIMPGKGERVWKVNVEGTKNVISAVLKQKVRRLVYTSSIHALRRVGGNLVMDENVAFDPDNAVGVYDRSKATASLAVLEAVQRGLDAVIVCPTGVVGPFDFRMSEMGNLIQGWMGRGLHFLIDGSFDFVDVRDVALGHILAAQKGRRGETYILSGEQINLVKMHELVSNAMGKKARPVKIPIWLAQVAARFTPLYYRITRTIPRFTSYSVITVTGNSRYSHKKSSHELGYQPRPLAESLVDTVSWWLQYKKLARSASRVTLDR